MSLVQKSYELAGESFVIWVYTTEDGSILFKGKEVAKALGYLNPNNALTKHVARNDKFEWIKVYPNQVHLPYPKNWQTSSIFINESGLYSLILRSKKPQAEQFKQWVTSEVLPSIRKTGKYEVAVSENGESVLSEQTASSSLSAIIEMQKIIKSKDVVITKIVTSLNDKERDLQELIEYTKTLLKRKNMEIVKITEDKNSELAKVTEEKNVVISSIHQEFKSYMSKLKETFDRENEEISNLKERAVSFPKNPKQEPYLAIIQNPYPHAKQYYSVCGQRDYVRKICKQQCKKDNATVVYCSKRPNPHLDWLNISESAREEMFNGVQVKRRRLLFDNKDVMLDFTRGMSEYLLSSCPKQKSVNSLAVRNTTILESAIAETA